MIPPCSFPTLVEPALWQHLQDTSLKYLESLDHVVSGEGRSSELCWRAVLSLRSEFQLFRIFQFLNFNNFKLFPCLLQPSVLKPEIVTSFTLKLSLLFFFSILQQPVSISHIHMFSIKIITWVSVSWPESSWCKKKKKKSKNDNNKKFFSKRTNSAKTWKYEKINSWMNEL